MNLYLQNIHNKGNNIYLFERLGEDLIISEDNSFYPYYYEPDTNGKYIGYDGTKLKKVICQDPRDVSKRRTEKSFESDIVFVLRYLVDKVDTIQKSLSKIFYIDIEILAPELPDTVETKYPISCITIYNSFQKLTKTWFLKDYGILNEEVMLNDFVDYIAQEKPDIITGWNIWGFDYPYLYNRIKDFSNRISPINQSRPGKEQCLYPAGISIVDFMGLYEKFTAGDKRASYALDYIAQEDLGEESWGTTEFGKLTDDIKDKNVNDVLRMVKLNDTKKVFPYFDEIRRLSKCTWESLPQETRRENGRIVKQSNNSKIIDMFFLREARDLGIILPRKNRDEEEEKLEGAYRDSLKTGRFFNVGKYDVSGAYLRPIIDYCLDSRNISESFENCVSINITDRVTNEIKRTVNIKQDPNALTPLVIKKLIDAREIFRRQVKETPENDPKYADLELQYKGMKGIVLSAWGSLAMQYFRLYDVTIASLITSIVRSLLHYIRDKLTEKGIDVIYVDTDSVFLDDKGKNITELLNQLTQQWSLEIFNKPTSIRFEAEGRFKKILILSKCHYYGFLEGRDKPEIKGIEVKRSSSSKYEARFQEEFIKKVLENETEQQILDWILQETKNIEKLSYEEIAFPCKIISDDYKVDTLPTRAYRNSRELFANFKVSKGELFYYIFIHPIGTDSKGKLRDVIAISPSYNLNGKKHLLKINWDEVVRRSILTKTQTIFETMGWKDPSDRLKGQLSLW